MAFVNVPNTARLEIRQSGGTQLMENVLHFKSLSAIDQDGLDTLTQVVDTWVDEQMKPFEPTTWDYRETYARGLDTAIDFESVNADSAGIGTRAIEPALPNNVAFCVRFLSGRTGRSSRGRFYWGLITGGDTTSDSQMVLTRAQGRVNALETLRSDALVAGWTQVVVSYVQEKVRLTTGLTYEVITSDYSDLTTDSMRRRLPGRGA